MSRYMTRYMHRLDQMTAQLREGCEELLEWSAKIQTQFHEEPPVPQEEIAASYGEWLVNSQVQTAVDDLSALVSEIKGDPEITDMSELQMDIISANEWALKLCMAMLGNSKLLAGYL